MKNCRAKASPLDPHDSRPGAISGQLKTVTEHKRRIGAERLHHRTLPSRDRGPGRHRRSWPLACGRGVGLTCATLFGAGGAAGWRRRSPGARGARAAAPAAARARPRRPRRPRTSGRAAACRARARGMADPLEPSHRSAQTRGTCFTSYSKLINR